MKKPDDGLTKDERNALRLRFKIMAALAERMYPDPDAERRRLLDVYTAMVERRHADPRWVM